MINLSFVVHHPSDCPVELIPCNNTIEMHCIASTYMCNDWNNCEDGEDEVDCRKFEITIAEVKTEATVGIAHPKFGQLLHILYRWLE